MIECAVAAFASGTERGRLASVRSTPRQQRARAETRIGEGVNTARDTSVHNPTPTRLRDLPTPSSRNRGRFAQTHKRKRHHAGPGGRAICVMPSVLLAKCVPLEQERFSRGLAIAPLVILAGCISPSKFATLQRLRHHRSAHPWHFGRTRPTRCDASAQRYALNLRDAWARAPRALTDNRRLCRQLLNARPAAERLRARRESPSCPPI